MEARDAGEVVFFATGFLALGFTELGFFLGAARPFPFSAAEPDAVSVMLFSGSILDFLATILIFG